jgi:BirA family biotin operon repressor/biotin-[acetyl-CoA-carboxylase] ligase
LRLNTEELGMVSRFSLLGCSALVDVLVKEYQLQGLIKWPNDVIVHGKKICGVLMEALWQGEQLQAVILGMGVNLACDAYPPGVELRYPATSVEAEAGYAPRPLEILEKLLLMLDQTRKNLIADDFIRAKNAHLAFRGEWVMLEENSGAPRRVRLLEIDHDGGLWVEEEDGSRSKVYAGELSG